MSSDPSTGPKAKSSKAKRAKAGSGRKRSKPADDLALGTDKLYFKIGEVAEIIGVAAHVLRYWESEFAIVKPHKSRSQQRVYRRKDVENLLRIKHLLYERKFTLAGARQELREGAGKIEPAPVSGLYQARQSLSRVREQLNQLAVAVRSEPPPGHLAADPANFVRSHGGATAIRSHVTESQGSPQPLLQRPPRDSEG